MKIVAAIAFLLLLTGILSTVFHFMNYNLKILFWMNEMSDNQQWLIRGAFIVVGLGIFLIFKKQINNIKK